VSASKSAADDTLAYTVNYTPRPKVDVSKLEDLASELRHMRDNYSLGIETEVSHQLIAAFSDDDECSRIDEMELQHYEIIDRALDVIDDKIQEAS
tara:strand:- start:83 stop:367 length:285 start_codon:yes stop_codon:yes gene_type:complete